MKAKHLLLISLQFLIGYSLSAQDYWYNPLNGVPFEMVINTTASSDTLIEYLNHEKTFEIDSTGIIVWNEISESKFNQIFGPLSYDFVPTVFKNYQTLFDSNALPSTWSVINWDSIVPNSAWLTNGDVKLTPGMMGTLNASNWYLMNTETAKQILEPTIPIIEGEDLDFSTFPGDILFDFEDYLTPNQEIDSTIEHSKYIFNKPDFTAEFQNGFIPWMIDTKPFLPDSFTFNTYHDWLYEYFHPLALSKIAEVLSTSDHIPTVSLLYAGNNLFHLTDSEHLMRVSLISTSGKVLYEINNCNQHVIDLNPYPDGIYLLDIQFDNNKHKAYKLFK